MNPLMKYHVIIEAPDGRRIKTWGITPTPGGQTKILDGIFDPESKVLSILLDSVTEQYTDFHVQKPNGKWEVQQRKIDQYYRLKLQSEDIPFFLDNFVCNNFDIEAVVEKPTKILTEEALKSE